MLPAWSAGALLSAEVAGEARKDYRTVMAPWAKLRLSRLQGASRLRLLSAGVRVPGHINGSCNPFSNGPNKYRWSLASPTARCWRPSGAAGQLRRGLEEKRVEPSFRAAVEPHSSRNINSAGGHLGGSSSPKVAFGPTFLGTWTGPRTAPCDGLAAHFDTLPGHRLGSTLVPCL